MDTLEVAFRFRDQAWDTEEARVVVPRPYIPELLRSMEAAHSEWQLRRGLELEDGTARLLDDGCWVMTGRRHVRDGARVMMLIAPGLFRLDVGLTQDTYRLWLRNLSGEQADEEAQVVGERVFEGPDGMAMRENTFAFGWAGGHSVRAFVRVPPWVGQLSLEVTAVAIIRPPR